MPECRIPKAGHSLFFSNFEVTERVSHPFSLISLSNSLLFFSLSHLLISMEFWRPLLLAAGFLRAAKSTHFPGCCLFSFLLSSASKSSVLVLSSLVLFISLVIWLCFLIIFLCCLCLIPHIFAPASLFPPLSFSFNFSFWLCPLCLDLCSSPYLKFLGSCSLVYFPDTVSVTQTLIHSLVECYFHRKKKKVTCYLHCPKTI